MSHLVKNFTLFKKVLKISVCDSADQLMKKGWDRFKFTDEGFFVDTFVGQLRMIRQCASEKHVQVAPEIFWDLSIPVPKKGPVRLNHCLALFAGEEIMTGDSLPVCYHCGARAEAVRQYKIERLPKVLVIRILLS